MDAVSVVAIVIPGPYEPEDFVITISHNSGGWVDAGFCLKSTPDVVGEFRVLDRYLGIDCLLSDESTYMAIKNLVVAVPGAVNGVRYGQVSLISFYRLCF